LKIVVGGSLSNTADGPFRVAPVLGPEFGRPLGTEGFLDAVAAASNDGALAGRGIFGAPWD
jgi:hypothetical protein